MFKKLLMLTLASLLTAATPVHVSAQSTVHQSHVEKIKAKVMKIGVGRARVSVKLRNHMKPKGYIGQIGENGFSLVDPKSGTVTPVPYDEVLEVKNINRSELLRLGIVTGTVFGLMLLIAFAARGA